MAIMISLHPQGVVKLTWPAGFKGAFRTTLFVGDGALETQHSFLVTVN